MVRNLFAATGAAAFLGPRFFLSKAQTTDSWDENAAKWEGW